MEMRSLSASSGYLKAIAAPPSKSARPCGELLAEFRPSHARSNLLRFSGVGDRDVYNVTSPFVLNGETLLAGRVEHRCNELSDVIFFRPDGETWVPRYVSPYLSGLQDPCIARIDGDLVIGGVRFPVRLANGDEVWRMEFYRGRTLATLERVLVGPAGMKDIRLTQLGDGRIAVFTRPQGVKGGRGKIGFMIADSLEQITPERILAAPILSHQFAEGEWGGANEVHLLESGKLGVLGHIACWDTHRKRHYYPMAFTLDPDTGEKSLLRIIARRDLFPEAAAKRPDLADVVFSGGLVRHANGTATMYAGLSDAAAGSILLPDPFTEASSPNLTAITLDLG